MVAQSKCGRCQIIRVSKAAASTARRAAEIAARSGYGRLLAILTAQTCDIAKAEDALSEAFASALASWPEKGVPDVPDAWLLTAARRRIIDGARQSEVRQAAEPDVAQMIESFSMNTDAERIPDRRLELMCMCAHPAIEVSIRTPLILQTILGLNAQAIAKAYLMKPSAMSQRLVRAKNKIKKAGIPFSIPEKPDWPGRFGAVLDAIYAAYTVGWDHKDEAGGLVDEAIWLARLVVDLAPDDAEAKGLLALMLFSESRRKARRSAEGHFVQLTKQDTSLWNTEMIEEAQQLMVAASQSASLSRYQIEAGIQNVHARRLVTGEVDWRSIAGLYEVLLKVAPSLGAHVASAAAIGEAFGADAGLERLQMLSEHQMNLYASYWAVRGHLLSEVGYTDEAAASLTRAAELTEDPATRIWLLEQKQRLQKTL